MAKMTVSGLDGVLQFSEDLSKDMSGIAKMAVYDGAEIIADEVKAAIKAIPEDYGYVKDGDKLSGITGKQKQGLIDGFGISTMKKDGDSVNVLIGFNGYNDVKTKKYPQGQPNSMIARSVESGSSIMVKRPFVRPTLNKIRSKVKNAVNNRIQGEINKRKA